MGGASVGESHGTMIVAAAALERRADGATFAQPATQACT